VLQLCGTSKQLEGRWLAFSTDSSNTESTHVPTVSAWVQEHLSDIIIALAAAIALAGGTVWWWRPLKAWWWRRAVRRLPDYLRSRAERYVGASKIFDIDDRVKMRNELCW